MHDPTLSPTAAEPCSSEVPGIAMIASIPPAQQLASIRVLPMMTRVATTQQMMAVLNTLVVWRYFTLKHWPRDLPDTMVSLAVPSCRVKARAVAKTSAQIRLRSNSAPALAQVTTVPGPTVQAASMVQYSMEATSCTRFDLIMLTLPCPAHNCS